MAIDLNTDWRIDGQMNYLKGVQLKHSKFFTLDESWDHHHCAFCSDKIDASYPKMAYCTADCRHWVCEQCYNDFKEMFEWALEEASPDEQPGGGK